MTPVPRLPGDLPPEEFRRLAHEAADWMADYLAGVGALPVMARVRPGDVRARLPASPPEAGEDLDAALADFRDIVLPGITHWNHPAFFGYFSVSGSGPGILGEMLTAALNVNAMVWRSSPAATELEEVTLDWLRQLVELPAEFDGTINDTASSSVLYALAAAREVAYPESHHGGLFGLPRGRIYASEHAHSSVEKAVLTLGLGRGGYRAIPSDDVFRMRPDALREACDEFLGGHRASIRAWCGCGPGATAGAAGGAAAGRRPRGRPTPRRWPRRRTASGTPPRPRPRAGSRGGP